MSAKNFVLAGIAGGITDFLLGWLFYGMIFRNFFPEQMPNMVFIFLGCMTFGFLISYIFTRWASIVTFVGGMKGGLALAVFIGLMNNFFMRSNSDVVDFENFAIDMLISLLIGAGVGGVVGAVNGALSKRPA